MTTEWPKHIPPFLERALRFDAEGRLWVARTPVPGRDRTYDVIDRNGEVITRIFVSPAGRILGFGLGRVYVSQQDVGGFERIERYDLDLVLGKR